MENSLVEPKVFINSTTPKLDANNLIDQKYQVQNLISIQLNHVIILHQSQMIIIDNCTFSNL